MSQYNEILRSMVRAELRRSPGFVFGQVAEPVGTLNRAAFYDAVNVADGVRNLTQYDIAAGENGLFVHLGDMQAAGFLQASHVNVGGDSPPIISV